MKKIQNTVLEENVSSREHNKEGKDKKNKHKKDKKHKDALSEIKHLNVTPKNKGANSIKLESNSADKVKNNKETRKSAKQGKNQESVLELEKRVTTGMKATKEKHKKTLSDKQESAQVKTPSTELTELRKIQKKKAKKLAKQLKKQKMAEIDDLNKSAAVTKILDSAAIKNSKVLMKKEKKAKKRQLTKDEKLAAKQIRDPAVEDATVFVGNIPVLTKRVQLVRLFKDFGPVNYIRLRSAGGKVLYKHKQRKAAGSLNAYVVLKNKESAEKAVSLNGVEFKGHHLRVTLVSNNPVNYEHEGKRTVFVGNLKHSATEENLRDLFSNCGEIDYVRCIRDGDKGCKGVAYVCFKTADAVSLALELHETIMEERPINVERYSVKKLGAKKARETQIEENLKKGAQRRLDINGKKEKSGLNKGNRVGIEDTKKAKKGEFRGVKVEGLKKNQKSKKKKSRDQMLQLAKKIAPKTKTE